MRRALVIVLAGALAACGGDDDDDNTPPPAATVNVTGGTTFTANTAIGYATTAPLSCSVEGVPTPVSTAILAVFVTDTGGDACALINANQERKGMGGISIFIARGNLLGTPTPIGAGTYTITSGSSFPAPDAQGNITIASAAAAKNQPGLCGAQSLEAESGTITISSVNGSVISGTIDANIDAADGGGKITGTFTTAPCALATPSCDAIVDDSPAACVD